MFGNQQEMPQQNLEVPQPVTPGQFGGNKYTPLLARGHNRFAPMSGGSGNLIMPPGITRIINNFTGNFGGGMPFYQRMPGYPPQGLNQQPPQQPMPPAAQGFTVNSYPYQGNAPQNYYHGYGGQIPVQPPLEEPKKGGIKGFIGNLMSKKNKQPQQQPMPPAGQGYPTNAYPYQGYVPQNYYHGYGGQMPVQPALEEPKKGGIKGFISNLVSKK